MAKCVEVWLARAEASDPALQEELQKLYPLYRNKKYTVAVFCSGEDDLTTLTSQLLVSNRRRLAESRRL